MNKSIPAFVIGLIFSIIGVISSFIFMFVFVLISTFSTGILKAVATIVPYINMATFILSFIGCLFCLTKPKIGGILMMISSVCSFICFIVLSITFKTLNVTMLLFWIPTILILVAALLALKKKKEPQLIS